MAADVATGNAKTTFERAGDEVNIYRHEHFFDAFDLVGCFTFKYFFKIDFKHINHYATMLEKVGRCFSKPNIFGLLLFIDVLIFISET